MKALVTAFEPFGGERVNASLEAVSRLPARIAKLDVVTAVLPTSYARSRAALEVAIAQTWPEIVLCVGQAGDRAALCVERVAINLQDARSADNDGAQPQDTPVVANAPAAYFSTLPVKKALAALQAAQLPAEISNSAGTFVCNHVFYSLMHYAANSERPLRGGFLHVPCLPGQVARGSKAPAMALDHIVRGIAIVLETAGKG
ncbi:MAG: pyroglutamyl-peptidase I [Pseudomonadota bacterium]